MMEALILEQELAEALQPYGLLVESVGDDLVVHADRLAPEAAERLARAGLARIPKGELATAADASRLIDRFDQLAQEGPSLFRLRPVLAPHAPAELPRSARWLQRYYGEHGFSPVNERKPAVIDHGRSQGPFLASIDAEPLVFFDASSQIATHVWGLNPPAVLESMALGRFGADPIANPDSSDEWVDSLENFGRALRVRAHEHFEHMAFANSGAEANEKALHIARINGRGGSQLLSFQGSFHGRTLLPLHGTWNPVKREPFELAGYQACWLPYPRKYNPEVIESIPPGWVESWSNGDGYSEAEPDFWQGRMTGLGEHAQALLAEEIEILSQADQALEEKAIFAVLIEAMQGEGGDNHLSSRFLSALLALCRRHNVPLVVDEVQTGMGLSGELFWHAAMDLQNADGEADAPDLVTLAKKAQLGAVLSRWPDPEPTEVQAASACRGLANLEIVEDCPTEEIAAFAEAGLKDLAGRLPEGLVTRVRGRGLAWAIDLPSGAIINRMLSERFWRGYLTYIAGKNTLRFRLNSAMTPGDWTRLMEALEASLRQMINDVDGFESPDTFATAVAELPPADWQAQGLWRAPQSKLTEGFRVEELSSPRLQELMDSVIELEEEAYEPARQESPAGLLGFTELPGYIGHGIFDEQGQLAAFSMGAALEGFPTVEGCNGDPTWGQGVTFYSLEMLVAAEHRGKGLGRALKSAQIEAAYVAGFDWVVGRNRVGGTREMGPLNRSMGAYLVQRLEGQYGEAEGLADYYRIPLYPGAIEIPELDDESGVDLGHGLQRPFGQRPETLTNSAERGSMGGAIANKLSLCNFTTPDTIRFAETLQALAPRGCDHVLYTSGRDEIVDKGFRALKYKNREGQIMLTLEHNYVGHTTAAARSLSWGRDGYFDWPSLPHPAQAGTEAALAALDQVLEQRSDEVLGLVCELFGEESGLRLPEDYLKGLEQRRQAGLKICVVETSTGGFRNGTGSCFLVDQTPLQPSQVWWYPGGQLGLVFCADEAWVEKPLQLISTWDGDELSMIRANHHLRTAWRQRDQIGALAQALADELQSLSGASYCGLHAFIPCDEPTGFAAELAEAGLVVKRRPEGIGLVPALNTATEAMARGLDLLKRRLS